MSRRRVVITGLGVICPVGNDLDATWTALLAGESGAGQVTLFDASRHSTSISCEVKDFDLEWSSMVGTVSSIQLFKLFNILYINL